MRITMTMYYTQFSDFKACRNGNENHYCKQLVQPGLLSLFSVLLFVEKSCSMLSVDAFIKDLKLTSTFIARFYSNSLPLYWKMETQYFPQMNFSDLWK